MFGQNTKTAKNKFIAAASDNIVEGLLKQLGEDEQVDVDSILKIVKDKAKKVDDVFNKVKIEALIGKNGAVNFLSKSFSTDREGNFVKLVKGATTNGDLEYYLTRTTPLSPVDAQGMSKIRVYLVNYLDLVKDDTDPNDFSEDAVQKRIKNVSGVPNSSKTMILGRKRHADINAKAHSSRLIDKLKILVTAWLIALIDLKPKGPEITKIEDNEYSGHKELKDFLIVDTVTSIGACAFKDCKNLKDINISNNVTKIGESAFYGCTKLDNVHLPHKIENIGASAFYGCIGLKTLKTTAFMTNPHTIEKSAFASCTALKKVDIYATKIGQKAFEGCSNLERIDLYNIAEIEKEAFLNCKKLKKVWIHENAPNIDNIDANAFKGCNKELYISLLVYDPSPATMNIEDQLNRKCKPS